MLLSNTQTYSRSFRLTAKPRNLGTFPAQRKRLRQSGHTPKTFILLLISCPFWAQAQWHSSNSLQCPCIPYTSRFTSPRGTEWLFTGSLRDGVQEMKSCSLHFSVLCLQRARAWVTGVLLGVKYHTIPLFSVLLIPNTTITNYNYSNPLANQHL